MDFYEPDRIATIDRLLRRTLVHSYRLSSLPALNNYYQLFMHSTNPPRLTQLNHFSTSPFQGGIVYNCNSFLFSCIKHSSFSTAPSKARCCANASRPWRGRVIHLLNSIIERCSE